MYHIVCDGVQYGHFQKEVAERWLESEGWVKGEGERWHFLRPGRATLFAKIEKKIVSESVDTLREKMRE